MIFACTQFNDLSSLGGLTAADAIFLKILTKRKLEFDRQQSIMFNDIYCFLRRLSDGFTGDMGALLPSKQAELAETYEKWRKK